MRYEACPEIIKYLPSCQYRTCPVFSRCRLRLERAATKQLGRQPSARSRGALSRCEDGRASGQTVHGPSGARHCLKPHAAVMAKKTLRSRPFLGQFRHVVQAVAHFLATACRSGPPAHRKPECPVECPLLLLCRLAFPDAFCMPRKRELPQEGRGFFYVRQQVCRRP